MDKFCIVCGLPKKGKPLKDIERAILLWLFPLSNFKSQTAIICSSCASKVKKNKKDYSYRNAGKLPRRTIALVLWDCRNRCPIYNKDMLPYMYSISPYQRLNGRFRNPNENLAINELRYPHIPYRFRVGGGKECECDPFKNHQ